MIDWYWLLTSDRLVSLPAKSSHSLAVHILKMLNFFACKRISLTDLFPYFLNFILTNIIIESPTCPSKPSAWTNIPFFYELNSFTLNNLFCFLKSKQNWKIFCVTLLNFFNCSLMLLYINIIFYELHFFTAFWRQNRLKNILGNTWMIEFLKWFRAYKYIFFCVRFE